ncbi:MAG: carboxypeptidase-like regulatory domain-containing protein [Chloroflexi bacterium]|nr:MAG: carboxypeptidase-like regulatory domain-containing protein [Chloroflexota bacterium]
MKSRFAYAAVLVLVALCAAPIGADAGKPVAVAARATPELALPLGATGAPSTALSLGVAREARALATTEANFPGIPDTGFDPSDGAIAAGPAHIVQAVNTTIAFFNRDGTKLGQVALGDFLRLPSSQNLTDPRVGYDQYTGHWVVAVAGVDESAHTSHLYFAYSMGADPTGQFCGYDVDDSVVGGVPNQVGGDFPTLAWDDVALYLSVRRFSFTTGLAVDDKVYLVPNPPVQTCTTTMLSVATWVIDPAFPDGARARILQPAQPFGAVNDAYLVASEAGGGSYIGLWRINNRGIDATMTPLAPVSVTPYAAPQPASQRDSSVQLAAFDARIPTSPIYRNGTLWFAFTVLGPAGLPAVRWYQLSPTALTVTQWQSLYFSGGGYSYPAIMVDASENMVLAMTINGSAYYPDVAIASRLRTDPLGTISQPTIYTHAIAPYERTVPGTPARWGDYFGIALDPDGARVWVAGTYPVSRVGWGTQIAATRASPAIQGVFAISGTISDSVTAARLRGACVVVAPATTCAATSDELGRYRVEVPGVAQTVQLTFKRVGYQPAQATISVNASMTYDAVLTPMTPTQTVYLPNITKTFGGQTGYETPFIVQDIGTAPTDLELTFFRFSDGSLVSTKLVEGLKPGTSYALQPNKQADLTDNTQFSVVVKSYGAPIVSVVNQISGVGANFRSGSYVGASSGGTTVFLPNITRRFFGFNTPFIMQNLGSQPATASASFVSFDGSKTATIGRTIAPGRSQVINPNSEAALVDGTQYSVVITSTQPLSVVVNLYTDGDPGVLLAMNGLTQGSANLYAPYLVKNLPGVGKGITTVVVQNVGAASATPQLTFTALGGQGAPTTFTGPAVKPGGAWNFDSRYTDGDTHKALCGAARTAGCLADGEYSFVASAPGAQLAGVVNVTGAGTAATYTTIPAAASKLFFPNLTRTLGGANGWTTPLVLQSVSATSVGLSWYRFADGTLAATQNLNFAPGTAQLVDPRTVPGLVDDTQYAVVATAAGGQIAGIVTELNFLGGDAFMIYEGFAGQ